MALFSPSAMDDSDWPAVVEYDTVLVPTRRLSVSALASTPPAWTVPSTPACDAAVVTLTAHGCPGATVPLLGDTNPMLALVVVAPCLKSADTEAGSLA